MHPGAKVGHSAPRPGVVAVAVLLVASLVAAVLPVGNSAWASSQAAASTVAAAVPSDAVMYIEVELDQESDQWVQTHTLLERAGLADLLEQEADASPEDVAQVAEMLALTGSAGIFLTQASLDSVADASDLTSEASALTTDPLAAADGDIPEGFAVVFQPDDPDALYATLSSLLEDSAAENGAIVETTEYNGVTITYWEAPDEFTDPMAIAQVGEYVVLSVRPADVEPVIDTANGELDTLADAESYVAVREALDGEALVFGYVDTEAVVDAAIAEDPSLAGSVQNPVGFAGWRMWADDPGFRLDTVVIPGAGTELPRMEAFTPTLAEQVSADSLFMVNSTNLAGTGIFDLLGVSLQAALAEDDTFGVEGTPGVAPATTPTVDEVYEQLEGQLGFNLKTDLFDQLTGEYGLALTAGDLFSDAPQIDAVFVSEVADETTVGDVTDKITFIISSAIEQEGATIAARDVPGGSLTSITIPDPSLPVTLEYGVVDGELLIGVNNGIDAYLEGPDEALADDAAYQDTFAALPQENITAVTYLNLGELLPLIEEAAMGMSGSFEIEDADPACAAYASQAEAQAAYEADDVENWMLDLDFDGQACEDFFGAGSPEASPVSVTEQLRLLSIGSVSYVEGDTLGTSSILLIGE